MSLIGRNTDIIDCDGKDTNLYLPSQFSTYRTQRNSQSWEDGSVCDGDRPNSRLTLIESPCHSHDLEDDISLVDLDSPDLADDQYPGSPQCRTASYCCEECLKCFSSPGKLKQHEYIHTGETPFECEVPGCVKRFTSKFKLKRHVLIHSQTKTFTCDICNRAFRRKDHLKNHEKVHDPGKTIYSCSYETCSRTYNSLSSFKKHQAMHCAEEGQLDCKICKTVLLNQNDLMAHLKIHTGSRTTKGNLDKKFCCNVCDKKFFTRKDLKRHSVVHTGNREFSCPHCSQRFGRKDHMTRHAKKTHQQVFETERQRIVSTPTPGRVEPAKNSRKERSVSDPGPVQSARFSPDSLGFRPLINQNNPTVEYTELNVLKPFDSPTHISYVLKGKEEGDGPSAPIYSPQSSLAVSSPRLDQLYIIPERSLNPSSGTSVIPVLEDRMFVNTGLTERSAVNREILDQLDESEMRSSDIKPRLVPVEPAAAKYSSLENLELARKEERKLELFPEDSNSAENAMKELLDEKNNIDFVTYISEMDNEIFQRKPMDMMEPTVFCPVKEEPKSPPTTPIKKVGLTFQEGGEELEGFTLSDHKISAKPIFIRTQSQDSLTKTKNPVLPSIHAEGALVVPEPKQVRYPSQDPFTLEFGEDSSQLTELKGSLFMTDEDNQAYFQPWQ